MSAARLKRQANEATVGGRTRSSTAHRLDADEDGEAARRARRAIALKKNRAAHFSHCFSVARPEKATTRRAARCTKIPAKSTSRSRGAGRYQRPSTPGPSPATVGLLLLRQADRRLGLTEALAQALPDWREKRRVEHSDLELIRQRIYGICAGYEDCNDAKTMRRDPALKAACDRDPDQGADLASQPTLSRFENEVGPKSCYLLAEKLFESYLQRHKQRPSRLILDPRYDRRPRLHGQQELRYFSAYYDEYVYQPLLIFDQDGDLIASVLQPGKSQGTRPAVAVLKRIIHRLRKKWPGVSILVRGDSGFASPELYRLCQDNKVDFLVGFGHQPAAQAPGRKTRRAGAPSFPAHGEQGPPVQGYPISLHGNGSQSAGRAATA